MRASFALRILLPLAAGLALDAPPARAALPPAATASWYEVRTARFRVLTDGDTTIALRAARHLERLADVLQLWTGLRVDGPWETRVFVFRDLADFGPYGPH